MNDEQLYAMRHSLAHITAQAVQHLWPEAKFGVGPVIENGFYYDIDLGETKISEDDFPKIEAEMRGIVEANYPFERSERSVDEAIAWAKEKGQPYKQELLNDLKREGTTLASELDATMMGMELPAGVGGSAHQPVQSVVNVSFYTDGDFTDLCRGPHATTTGSVGVFKLTKVAGAYWRGKTDNAQMQRLYGVAFQDQKTLDDYLTTQEEAKARDHRKLGQELDLFTFSDLVGPGLPLYTPRGTVLIEELKGALKDISRRYGMLQVSIPHLAKIELYETSGHASKFSEELFHVQSHYDQQFVLKPVNCPHHTQIYASRPRSYRDLPLRYIEQTMQYRDEKPGQLGGLQRTRGFTVDDGHTFCRPDQIEQEATMIAEVIEEFYSGLGLWGEHWVSLSVRDVTTPDKYIGEPAEWDTAEEMLARVADKKQLDAKRMEGEAALYGPKLDFMFKDALGRETQLATIQIDFAMPHRFGLEYTDEHGEKKRPVMVHRAILGSFERFIMLLIEHYAGKFPLWLSPEQLRIIQVKDSEDVMKFVQQLRTKAEEAGLRVSVDDTNESVGKKIRSAEVWKVPYTVVIGEKEVQGQRVSPRVRADLAVPGDVERNYSVDQLLASLANEVKARASKSSI